MDYRLVLTSITEANKHEKYVEAVDQLAKALKLPVTIRPDHTAEDKEEYSFKAQEELVNRWKLLFGAVLDNLYYALCGYLDLPVITTFSKALDDDRPLIFRGKLMYNPETGKPLKVKDWNNLIAAIEKFLNRKLKGTEKKIVLDSAALGRVISRMLKYNTAEAVKALRLEEVKYKEYSWTDLSESLKAYKAAVNPPDTELFRLQLAEETLGNHITAIGQDTLKDVKSVFLEGIKQRKNKRQVSQDLFDRLGSVNKDWERITEFETNNTFNNAFINEELGLKEPEEKVYLRRVEMGDVFVCIHCRKIKGILVLVVEEPLEDEKIDDKYAKVAIWPDKSNIGRNRKDWWVAAGVQHPYCRGSWYREYPDREEEKLGYDFGPIYAKREKEDTLWGEAMNEVLKEKEVKQSDPDFLDKVKKVFKKKMAEAK